ncbi:MAG: hypothetical protein IKB98_10725 [Clostridia bacterium]|nr:hypothetical protein [Clostridia bacterium]MBR2871823.1 hypothetical protein [Clostridia bacterium]
MKKFIVSQNRKVILEVTGSIEMAKDYLYRDFTSYGIILNGSYVGEGYTEDEAKNQLLLIADFLNKKGTINDVVYFMPVLKQKNKKYRLIVYSYYEEDEPEPYTVEYDSMTDALYAKEQYENEFTLAGQHAYSVVGPNVIEE